jgi:hypothetical protein
MSAEPTRLTDDDRRKLTHIPDSVETRDVLENLLFDLFIRGILPDNIVVRLGNQAILVTKEGRSSSDSR